MKIQRKPPFSFVSMDGRLGLRLVQGRALPEAVTVFAVLAVFLLLTAASRVQAQNLTLEGQTGGFITPTGYTVQSPGHFFSAPVVSFHYVRAGNVIGDIHTLSVTEGLGNRFEVGYTRSIHTNGDNPFLSPLWAFNGFNVVHGKVNVIPENARKIPFLPAIGVGFVYRSQDHYVSGALAAKTYNNGDVYIAGTKMLLNLRPPLLLNFGFKGTNGSIYGVGGNSPAFVGRLFGGLGIILPGPFGVVFVPAAGFTQEPRRVQNLPAADIPTTLDYAVRITQRKDARFAFDAGVGQVAGRIIPGVNLNARSVFGMGLSYKF
jgi:hypothetical protein